jgi:diacylglycerol kinase family enzyme
MPPEASMDQRYHIIFNPNAGTALASGITTAVLSDHFTRAGLTFDIDDDDDEPLADRIERALHGPADVIVAAGGDGTVIAVGEKLIGTDKTLAVLPLGTMNGLARDLGLALDLPTAVNQLPTLVPRAIDVAEVNGRSFLHNVIIGLIPNIAVGREWVRGQGWIGKFRFVQFSLRLVSRAKRIAVAMSLDGAPTRIERVQTLVVANNSYDQRFGAFMARRRIDRGTLTAYLIRSLKLNDMLRLAFEMLAGKWRNDEVVEYERVKELVVGIRKPRVLVTMDGEILWLDSPLQFSVRPKSLNVLAAAEPAPATTEQPAAVVEQV